MNIPPTFSKSASAVPPSFTANDLTKEPRFVRPAKDRAPASGVHAPYMPGIDPNASPEEKQFFRHASDLAGSGFPGLPGRLMLLLRNACGGTAPLAQFTFEQKPASVQAREGRVVINVGLDDDDAAGQLTMMNGHIEQAKGTLMNNPLKQVAAMQRASVALALGIAERNDMPHATAALHEVQKYIAPFNEFGQHVWS